MMAALLTSRIRFGFPSLASTETHKREILFLRKVHSRDFPNLDRCQLQSILMAPDFSFRQPSHHLLQTLRELHRHRTKLMLKVQKGQSHQPALHQMSPRKLLKFQHPPTPFQYPSHRQSFLFLLLLLQSSLLPPSSRLLFSASKFVDPLDESSRKTKLTRPKSQTKALT